MIGTDLFSFAYIPSWYDQLDNLARLALPEPWRFLNPAAEIKNRDTPILERYINAVFRKQMLDCMEEKDPEKAKRIFYIANQFACFHTGLYTKYYKAIYACFEPNRRNELRNWKLNGFVDDSSPMLRYIDPLPQMPVLIPPDDGVHFRADWYIRVNVDHILEDQENRERIPEMVRDMPNLPLLLETAVELGRRKALIEPTIVVPQVFQQRVQYLLPICLTNMVRPDLAMTLTAVDGFYLGQTCLTLEMAYCNARLLSRPTADWLTALCDQPMMEQRLQA